MLHYGWVTLQFNNLALPFLFRKMCFIISQRDVHVWIVHLVSCKVTHSTGCVLVNMRLPPIVVNYKLSLVKQYFLMSMLIAALDLMSMSITA